MLRKRQRARIGPRGGAVRRPVINRGGSGNSTEAVSEQRASATQLMREAAARVRKADMRSKKKENTVGERK